MDNLRLQILEFNYWEHYKITKDYAMILSIDHPKRKEIESSMNEVLMEIHKIKGNK